MICWFLIAAAAVLGLLARHWNKLALAAMPLTALGLLAGFMDGLESPQLMLCALVAAIPALAGRAAK